jgi:hypothetical protein
VKDLAEPLENLDEAAVLAFGEVGVDDVVVQKVGASARSYSEELVSGTVDEDGSKRADFGGDVNWHRVKIPSL